MGLFLFLLKPLPSVIFSEPSCWQEVLSVFLCLERSLNFPLHEYPLTWCTVLGRQLVCQYCKDHSPTSSGFYHFSWDQLLWRKLFLCNITAMFLGGIFLTLFLLGVHKALTHEFLYFISLGIFLHIISLHITSSLFYLFSTYRNPNMLISVHFLKSSKMYLF